VKAIVQEGYGPPAEVLRLRDVAPPTPGTGEVLVRVRASAVAIGDWLTTQGQPYIARPMYGIRRPKRDVAGFELAGTVEAVGPDVTGFRPGDEVFGSGTGTLAELAVVATDAIAPKPGTVTFEQAAGVPISAIAALQALRDAARVRPGQRVLILGASGGVGTFAVQIAKAMGAEVTGVCGPDNVDLVAAIGADHVIDYTREDFAHGGRRYDVIVDLVGKRSLADCRRALRRKGTLVMVGGSGGRWTMGFGRTVRGTLLSPFVSQRLRPFFSKASQADLLELKELIDSGRVTPVIDRTYPLSSAPDALRYVGERHTQGKTVVTV
jgi:NADPH:quinone reductase-like Zn-dependent oxidoreductase